MSGSKRICAKCGKEFFGSQGERFCNSCAVNLIRGDSGKQEIIKNFVRDNQGVSEHEVMEKFGVSKKFVRQMFSNRIFTENHKNLGHYPCEHCGKMISEGVYCKDCFILLRKEIKKHSEQMMYLRGILKPGNVSARRESVILIVDHDEMNLNVMKFILQKGLPTYKISLVGNLIGAMNAIHNQNVCLVILDDSVSNYFDGFEILKKIRADEQAANVPIIILSSNTEKQNIAAGILNGATDFVSKPCEPNDLVNRVKKNLGLEIETPQQIEEKEKIDYDFEKIYKILLIENDDDDVRIESAFLENNFPCEIFIAPNGIEGLHMLSNEDFETDIVLVNLEMPFMDGFEFMDFVAEDENMRKFPVVVMTESDDEMTLNKIKKSLAKGYITKPEFSDESLDLIEQVLLKEI